MEITKNKLIRITTVPLSLDLLLSGQLNYMKSFYEVTAVSSEDDYLKKIGTKENVKTFTIEMSRKITPMNDLAAVVKLFLFLKKERPLIVHSHTPKAGILSMIASKCAGVPIRLHTVGGLPLMETKGLKRNILQRVEKLTYSCATMVYPNSKGLYDFIVTNKLAEQGKLKVISNGSSNGINANHFAPEQISKITQQILKTELEIQNEDFVFIFVGRLVGDKGINELVQAFKKIIKKNLNVKLLLVGMYEKNLDPLDDLTYEEINSNKNILFVGFQKDIRPYLAISNVLVFASYREGFPNVVLQAGAMGLPSIVTNINGCNEIIRDGKNGIIIPVKNREAIEKAALRMINEKDFFTSLQSNARDMVISRYDQRVIWESILAEYEQVEKKQQKLIVETNYKNLIKPWKTDLKIQLKNSKSKGSNTINDEKIEEYFTDNRKLYIFGAGGHGKVITELMSTTNCKIEALFDDAPNGDKYFVPVYNSKEMVKSAPDVALIIAIENNHTRKKISSRFSDYNFFSSVHKSAYVSPSATVGLGTVVMLQAIINANVKIGKHVIINTAAIIEHDCIIEDFVHISPKVILSGNIHIGLGSHLGAGVIVSPRVKIGKWCTIGAGTVVINDIPDGVTVVGNPGKIISLKNSIETSVYNEEMLKNIEAIKINSERVQSNT